MISFPVEEIVENFVFPLLASQQVDGTLQISVDDLTQALGTIDMMVMPTADYGDPNPVAGGGAVNDADGDPLPDMIPLAAQSSLTVIENENYVIRSLFRYCNMIK